MPGSSSAGSSPAAPTLDWNLLLTTMQLTEDQKQVPRHVPTVLCEVDAGWFISACGGSAETCRVSKPTIMG